MGGFISLPRKVVKSVPSVRFLFVNPLFVYCIRINSRVVQSSRVVWMYTQCMNNSSTQSSSLDVGNDMLSLCN